MTYAMPGNWIFTPEMAAELDRITRSLQREQAERQKERDAAEARARKLFLSKLTPVQRKTLDEGDEIFVRGSKGNWYRINCRHTAENVWSVPLDGQEEVYSYCAGPLGVPPSDVWLAQKLLIEADEDAFLAVAVKG